jgi:hydrogenase 3 maturation protease
VHTGKLLNHLKLFCKDSLCIVGIGNELKGDDGAGVIIAERIQGKVNAQVICAGVTPENYLEKIVRLSPRRILLIDAADFDGAPGEAKLFDYRKITGGTISTHALSLAMFYQYLSPRIDVNLYLLGIQPVKTSFGSMLSSAVYDSVEALVAELEDLCPVEKMI